MSKTTDDILNNAMRLSTTARAELAAALLASLDGEPRRPSKPHGRPRFSDVLSACALARPRGEPGLRFASVLNVVENEPKRHRPRRGRGPTVRGQKWDETQRSGLGEEFRSAIDEAMERLLKAPLAASPIVNLSPSIDVRRVLVKRFPYSIVFINDDEDLWVVGCPSTSATRLLARTAETVDGSPPPYYHAVNHCVEEDVRTRLSPIALNVIMRLAS
jgi:hypothetical protein